MSDAFLMCKPDYFSVDYVINPWMKAHVHQSELENAVRQWQAFYDTLKKYVSVALIEPQPNLPDFVFTANAGFVKNKFVMLSHFRHPERQKEEVHYTKWFKENGYKLLPLPKNIYFEGEGDVLSQSDQNRLWMGYGFRSDLVASEYLESFYSAPVIPLKLTNEYFYHLDTCFCPLLKGCVMYYPGAFDPNALILLEENVPQDKRIIVNEEDALLFACNAVVIETDKIPGKSGIIFMHGASAPLHEKLEALGYHVQIQPVSEFLKAGGANKCLTLTV